MSIAMAHAPLPTERRHSLLETLHGAVPPPFVRPSGNDGPAPSTGPRARGLESVSQARSTLARMLGSIELLALNGPDDDRLEDFRRDAASIATNLCGITSAFVALAADERDDVPMAAESVARPVAPHAAPTARPEERARLDHLCSMPVKTVEIFVTETSLALNKMAATFMRVAGCIDLDDACSAAGYDPREDLRNFPRFLTEATAAIQASDYELRNLRNHQRLLAAVLAAARNDAAVARALDDCGDLGPLGSLLRSSMTSSPSREDPSEDDETEIFRRSS